jgi:hypothetical protein
MTSPVIWQYRNIIWVAGWWLLLSYDSIRVAGWWCLYERRSHHPATLILSYDSRHHHPATRILSYDRRSHHPATQIMQVHCVFFVVIWIFGVLCHFQQYHGDQFTKPGANPRHIGDRLVWAVRSNDLTHWTIGRHDIAESGIKHQKFKFKLQQKIHNVPEIKNKQYIIIIHKVIKQKHTTFSNIMATNLQSQVRTHAILVIGL